MIKNINLTNSIAFFVVIILMALSNYYWETFKWGSIPLFVISLFVLSSFNWEDKNKYRLLLLSQLVFSLSIYNILAWGVGSRGFIALISCYFILVFFTIFFSIVFDSDDDDIKNYSLKFVIGGLLYWFLAMAIRKLDVSWLLIISVAFPLGWYILSSCFNDIKAAKITLITTIILLCSLGWSNIPDKQDYVVTSKEEAEIVEKTDRKEAIIKNAIVHHFDNLKREKRLSSRINPEFKLEQRIEGNKRIIKAEFSYEIIKDKKTTKNESFEDKITDYEPGHYHLNEEESPGAYAMAYFVGIGVERFLKENLEGAEQVDIELHGYSDALKFDPKKPKIYDGQVEFPRKENQDKYESAINNYYLNNREIRINLKEGDILKNETLAFLRAFYLKYEYFNNNIPFLKEIAPRTHYTYHANTQNEEGEIGGKYRKSKVVIEMINTRLNGTEVHNSISADRCKNFTPILICLLGLPIAFIGFHYKKYYEKKEKGEDYKDDLRKVIIAAVIIALILIVAYWWCPNSFPF